MPVLLQFAIGLIFGLGLLLSGMSNPAKVLNFLDLVGFNFVLKRSQPLFAETFHLPTKAEIDRRIILGPAIFGVGWGLAGFCPGPALTALGFGSKSAVLFVAAMLAGMVLAHWIVGRAS